MKGLWPALFWTAGVLAATGTEENRDLPVYQDIAPALGMTGRNEFGGFPKRFITETTGSGAAFLDYDSDGNLDLYVVNGVTREQSERGLPGPPDQLYRNLGDGRFQEVAALAGTAEAGWGGGAAAADYDNDGDPDLLVTNYGGNVFYRNNGDGTFTDITERAGLTDHRWSTSAAFGDINGDGYLDLYVCHYIAWDPRLLETLNPEFCRWRSIPVLCGPRGLPGDADSLYLNQGDGSFREVTRSAGVYNPEGRGLGVAFLDIEGDGDQDIFVANDSSPNFLYQNDGWGRFQEVGLPAGVAFSTYGQAQAGMGADTGDYDEDGKPDLVVTNFQGDYNALRRNLGGGLFMDASDITRVAASSWDKLSWGVKFLDANLDGFLDLLVVNGHIYPEVDAAAMGESYAQPSQLLLNVPSAGGRRYLEVSEQAGLGPRILKSSRGLAVADYDNDGDLDAFVNNINDVPTLLQDQASHRNRWIRLRPVGRRSNRDGMGVRVEYETGGRRHHRYGGALWSYLSTSDPRLLLGLGQAPHADDIVIEWPAAGKGRGPMTRLGSVASGQELVVLEARP